MVYILVEVSFHIQIISLVSLFTRLKFSLCARFGAVIIADFYYIDIFIFALFIFTKDGKTAVCEIYGGPIDNVYRKLCRSTGIS